MGCGQCRRSPHGDPTGWPQVFCVEYSAGVERLHRLGRSAAADQAREDRAPVLEAGRIMLQTSGPGGAGAYGLSTLGGSAWHWVPPSGDPVSSPGNIAPSRRGSVQHQVLAGGVPALVYLPSEEPTAAVISLHGGPESVERDELRYDGLYRSLLARRTMVIGLNYPGSIGYGKDLTTRAWGTWRQALQDSLDGCETVLREHGGLEHHRCVLLGGSFGGSLALLAAQLWPSAAGAIACSPVVDLQAHAHRAAKQDRRYADWFEKRFGLCQADRAAAAFSPDNLVDTGSVPVLVVHGTADEVVDYGLTKAAVELAQRTGRSWSLVTENDGAHVPASPDSAQTRSDLLLASVARLLDAV